MSFIYELAVMARRGFRLSAPPGLSQLTTIFADLDSAFFSTVSSSTLFIISAPICRGITGAKL